MPTDQTESGTDAAGAAAGLDPDDREQYERQYSGRKRALQTAIDALAQHDPAEIEEHGAKTRIAREHGVETHQIDYVRNRWNHLVKWRRQQFRNPMDPDIGSDAITDDHVAKLAADGVGEMNVTLDVSLVDAYRMQHSLPSDLSTKVWVQTLEAASDMSSGAIRRIFESRGSGGGD